MVTNTPNYGFKLPGVNDPTDEDQWGTMLNENFESLDGLISSAINTATSTKTSNYTVVDADANTLILVDATSGDINITLPASPDNGFTVSVKKNDISANSAILVGTIDGGTNLDLANQYQAVTVVFNGTNYSVKSMASKQGEALLLPTGYKVIDGLTFQWGVVPSIGVDSYADVVFPKVFNIPFIGIGGLLRPSVGNGNSSCYTLNLTTTGMRVYNDSNDLTPFSCSAYWFALGV